MLHIENDDVKNHILDGNFGLEKESLRILKDGTLSHSLHPFPDDEHIVKNFCENQTEINTSIHTSAKEAIGELEFHNERIHERLKKMTEKEYLWPFSNPPGIFFCKFIIPQNILMDFYFSSNSRYYNTVRPQAALNWLSPIAYEHLLSVYAAKVA